MSVTLDRSHAEIDLLRDSLAAGGQAVELRQTHGSVVFLVGDRAYKLRRPVRFEFADQSSAAERARICAREVALNAELAPSLAQVVRSVIALPDGGYRLGDAGDPDAVDHLIEMRRFDEGQTLRAQLTSGTLRREQVVAVGRRVAEFHAGAERQPAGADYRELVDRNFEALIDLGQPLLTGRQWLALQRFSAAFLLGSADVLAARAHAGHVVDGHGDLRAEHILLEDDGVAIVDRLEIDSLRVVDVADELAFLMMELLELSGSDELGEALLEGYVAGGGRPQPATLLAFFQGYRAQVRAMVRLLHEQALGDHDGSNTMHARRLLALSRRLAWRARGPMLLLVTGPPASGKSTLARELGQLSGFPVLSSDSLRRSTAPHRYSLEARAAVYRELARRAAGQRSVIVDATFGEPQLEQAFVEELAGRDHEHRLVIECSAPAAVRARRARDRQLEDPQTDSEAGPAVAVTLGQRFSPIHDVSPDARHLTDGTAFLETQVADIEAWLDLRLATGTGT